MHPLRRTPSSGLHSLGQLSSERLQVYAANIAYYGVQWMSSIAKVVSRTCMSGGGEGLALHSLRPDGNGKTLTSIPRRVDDVKMN